MRWGFHISSEIFSPLDWWKTNENEAENENERDCWVYVSCSIIFLSLLVLISSVFLKWKMRIKQPTEGEFHCLCSRIVELCLLANLFFQWDFWTQTRRLCRCCYLWVVFQFFIHGCLFMIFPYLVENLKLSAFFHSEQMPSIHETRNFLLWRKFTILLLPLHDGFPNCCLRQYFWESVKKMPFIVFEWKTFCRFTGECCERSLGRFLIIFKENRVSCWIFGFSKIASFGWGKNILKDAEEATKIHQRIHRKLLVDSKLPQSTF